MAASSMSSGTKALVYGFGVLSGLLGLIALREGLGAGLLVVVSGWAGSLIYFLPSIVAFEKRHTNSTAIFAINLLLGWIVIGWIAGLIWALARDRASELLEQQERERNAQEERQSQARYQQLKADLQRTRGAYDGPASSGALPAADERQTKTCPFCAEQVLRAAIKCKHCASDLTALPT